MGIVTVTEAPFFSVTILASDQVLSLLLIAVLAAVNTYLNANMSFNFCVLLSCACCLTSSSWSTNLVLVANRLVSINDPHDQPLERES